MDTGFAPPSFCPNPPGSAIRLRGESRRILLPGDERLPEGPASGSGPGPVVEGESVAECAAAFAGAGEEGPCDRQVAGGVPHREAPEVDHGGQAPLPLEEVPRGHVSVHPHRRAGPEGREGFLPGR